VKTKIALHDVVALLEDLPAQHLARGQVGTIVELPNSETALVEFSDDKGRAYAIAPVNLSRVLPLQYEPEVA
jgi:Domain of unknown function (DUF4926)